MLQLVILAGYRQQRRAAHRPFGFGCVRGRRLWAGAVRACSAAVRAGKHA